VGAHHDAQSPDMIEDLVHYLQRSGLVIQSVDALRNDLARWERFLRRRGHDGVPNLSRQAEWTPAEARAANCVDLLISQAAGNQDEAHYLRNLTRVRPVKP
jgi:hypothetical protein